ncbi:hypothetical protein DT075_07475 [Bacillus licheniformis]|nr:hypothetical protein DT075_07475 [Bacillus licheniformis]
MGKVYVFDHPLIQHKLTYIRDVKTGTKEFRELVDEVATLMAFEITLIEEVGAIIALALKNHEDEAKLEEAKQRVEALTNRFPLYTGLDY